MMPAPRRPVGDPALPIPDLTLDPRLSQHLLVSPDAVSALLDAALIEPDDVVLEIGAGAGHVTWGLVERARRVVAFEIDERFRPHLARALAGRPNVELRFEDFRRHDLPPFDRLVANPPFHLLEAILAMLVDRLPAVRSATMVMGEGYGESCLAQPGEAAFSRTSLITQAHFHVEVGPSLAASDFLPPVAGAAVVTLRPLEQAPPVLAALADAVRRRGGMRVRDLLWHVANSNAAWLRRIPRRRQLVARAQRGGRLQAVLGLRLQALSNVQLGLLVSTLHDAGEEA